MKRFPAFIDVTDRRVVIAGEGEALIAKARLMAAAGADLLIVTPKTAGALEAAIGGNHKVIGRAPAGSDFAGALIAIIAGVDADEVRAYAKMAREQGAIVNVVDQPALSDFITPSIVDRGEIVVAVSTGGAAPVLGRRIRTTIEQLLPLRLGALASFAGSFRHAVAGKIAPPLRRNFWERFFDGPIAARFLAGDERGAREAMIAAVNQPRQNESTGAVHIVGAGPGDPELLTLKAHRLIQHADVIVYDRLVGEGALALARRDAERFYVGKAKGAHVMTQEEINALLVRLAQQGKTVVRLKGGDPFIFGRGGEELDVLRKAGVAAFVTPGVTAAAGCAAAAGMALTHRSLSQAVTFVTGHAKGDRAPDLDWASLARLSHTLVVYMGVSRARAIEDNLIAHGRAAATPVAVIENGTLSDQRIVKGRLDELSALIERESVAGPAVLVVGEVAALAEADIASAAIDRALLRSAA